MSLFSKDIKSLNDLFVSVLKTTYYAEKEIRQALPVLIEKSSSPALKQGLESHLRETENHITRLEQVFRMHGVEPEESKCPAIDGIIKAGNSLAGDIDDQNVLDAGIIAAAQMVEHYEMAQYGSLIAWARQLGRDDCAGVLSETLAEEKAADQKLSQLGEGSINRHAA